MNQTIYKSHTHGPIPLSAKGKRLMQYLREEIGKCLQKNEWTREVSYARGELAKYMSELEKRPAPAAPVPPTMRPKWTPNYLGGYQKLLADMRGDVEQASNKAFKDALLYGEGRVKVSHVPDRETWGWAPNIYSGSLKENLIQGARANLVMIDDPQNEQELDMSKKAVATRKRAAKAQAKMQLAGVRFIHGPKLDTIYTYKAKRTAKLHLGQEVVVRNQHGTSVGIVVQLEQPMPLGYTMETVVELTDKVAAI